MQTDEQNIHMKINYSTTECAKMGSGYFLNHMHMEMTVFLLC